MSKEERYAEHTVAWELPKCDTVTKGNYNLADIEMKYMPIQTEVVSDSKDKIIADLQSQLAEKEKEIERLNACVDFYKSYYISFREKVIDELEKVKDIINASVRDDHIIWDFDIKEHIDSQIKQLKEGK